MLFKLIRYLRNRLPPPDRKLKGCCKMIRERLEEKEMMKCVGDEEDEACEEGGEEEERTDDPIVEVKPVLKKVQKYAAPPTGPVRRIKAKTAEDSEEILFVGSCTTPERKELDEIRLKIAALQLGEPEPYTDHSSCMHANSSRPGP